LRPAIHTPGPWWLRAGNGCVHVGGPTIDKQIALVTTCDAVGVANARLISRAPEMLDALAACVFAGADLQAGKRDGATMGRVSLATDNARALLAFILGEATP
jgi:hypothetical protein